jgi:hypothetical protein
LALATEPITTGSSTITVRVLRIDMNETHIATTVIGYAQSNGNADRRVVAL